jgi:RNA polymerase sigma-70 factor (ECF subfamily)
MTAGLEAIFLANREPLLRFLRARRANDPEDLLQELWFKAAAATGPISDPLAYLYRVANNLMLDKLRGDRRRDNRDHNWACDTGELSSEASPEPSQERVLLAREQFRAAEAILLQLGERTDIIFRRFRLDGISQGQIAAELEISVSAVEKHLQRAYRALSQFRRQFDAD